MLQLGYCFIAARLSQDIDVFGPVGAVGLPGLQAMYADTRLSPTPNIVDRGTVETMRISLIAILHTVYTPRRPMEAISDPCETLVTHLNQLGNFTIYK